MIPRTALMAQEIAAQFTPTQLDDYGNIILNGYPTTGPNTTGKLAWRWADRPAPGPLPTVTSVRPVLKGWTTNYQEYFTRLLPNPYNTNPGDPTMFEYTVRSFSSFEGPIATLGGNGTWLTPGTGYTPGTYTGVALTGGSGAGATADIVVVADPDITGYVESVTLVNPGTGYTAGDSLSAVIPGGSGFYVPVGEISPTAGLGGEPRWGQPPRRLNSNLVAPFVPPTPNRNAIQYSAILYPATV